MRRRDKEELVVKSINLLNTRLAAMEQALLRWADDVNGEIKKAKEEK